jgi:branched-chain amino acid aminotransferase
LTKILFQAADTVVTKATTLKEKPSEAKFYKFGQIFTDHMVTIDWSKADGWEKPQIQPYGPLELATSATVLHYGISAYASLAVCENAKTNKLQAFRTIDHLD